MRVEHEGGANVWLSGTLVDQLFRDTDCPCPGVVALSESFLKPLAVGDQKASLASLAPYLCPFGHLECSLAWGTSLLFGMSGP